MKKNTYLHLNSAVLIMFCMGMFLVVFFITKTQTFIHNSVLLSNAVIFDLLFTIPTLFYFFKKYTSISKLSILPIITLSGYVGTKILPPSQIENLSQYQFFLLPTLEIVFFGFIAFKIYNSFKERRHISFSEIVQNALMDILPAKVSKILIDEFTVLYYFFFIWKKRNLNKNEFSYHRKNSLTVILSAVLVITLIESFALHFLLIRFNYTMAWIVSFLSVYSTVLIGTLIKSLGREPIIIENDVILLRFGILKTLIIPKSAIGNVIINPNINELNEQVAHFQLFKNSVDANVLFILKQELTIKYLYGIEKKANNIAFYVDELQCFECKMNDFIHN